MTLLLVVYYRSNAIKIRNQKFPYTAERNAEMGRVCRRGEELEGFRYLGIATNGNSLFKRRQLKNSACKETFNE